jgi:hypothetical protein
MFAKVVHMDQVSMLEANAPVMFPPVEKMAILDLRKKIVDPKNPLTPELLNEYDFEMLDIYHDIVERLLNPVMPQFQNTDGEPLAFYTLLYSLKCSPQEAFDILKHLNVFGDEETMLEDAEFDAKGQLREIQFPWSKHGNKQHKSWDNTILGHLTINGVKLSAEVNSENRAQQFKVLMEQLLPGKARYKTTVIESTQAKLAQMQEEKGSSQAKQRQKEREELNNSPEVQEQLAKLMSQHYREWVNQKLPALKGKTPLQAVKTQDGKEMVEALILELQRSSKRANQPIAPAIIAELRERLGLP